MGYNQVSLLRVNSANHAVLYWLREMDIIEKINVIKRKYNIEI